MPASQGRSSAGAASIGGLPSGRSVPARTSTVRVPAPVSQARSTPSRTVTPRRSSACTSAGSRSEGAITTITWESARAAKAPSASVSSGCLLHDARRIVLTARRHQPPAQDHDAGPLPLLEPPGDVAAGGPRAVGGLGGEQEVADDLDPPAEGHREGAVRAGRGGRLASHPRVGVGSHSSSIVSPSGAPAPPQLGGIAPPGAAADAVRLVLRARDQARGGPDQLDVARRGRRATPRWAGRHLRHRRRPLRRRRPPALPRARDGGTGRPSSRPAATTP